jgi:hypothetical protein
VSNEEKKTEHEQQKKTTSYVDRLEIGQRVEKKEGKKKETMVPQSVS